MKITKARARWLSWLGVNLLRALGCTWRIRVRGAPPPRELQRVIFAFLHGDLLVPAYSYRKRGAAVLVSQHGDGELIAQILERLGYVTVRGSSTRGGARAVLELLRDYPERMYGITPDGPRGPRGKVQEGVIQLAVATGRPIYAMSLAVARAKRLSSWDRFTIPLPFARIAWHYSEPMLVAKGATPAQRAEYALELEQRFENGQAEAQKALTSW